MWVDKKSFDFYYDHISRFLKIFDPNFNSGVIFESLIFLAETLFYVKNTDYPKILRKK